MERTIGPYTYTERTLTYRAPSTIYSGEAVAVTHLSDADLDMLCAYYSDCVEEGFSEESGRAFCAIALDIMIAAGELEIDTWSGKLVTWSEARSIEQEAAWEAEHRRQESRWDIFI